MDARVWWRIGCLSFGGPAGQIALMQRMLVDELGWIDSKRFLAGLNFCMLLPGPEAQQLATYIGWTRGGWRGAIVAGSLFVIPGMLVMLALSAAYVGFGRLIYVEALFFGVKCAVVAIVIEALLRIAKRALVFRGALWVALTAFVLLHVFAAPYPAIVAIAGAVGWLVGRRHPSPTESGLGHYAPAVRTQWPLIVATAVAWLAPLGLLLLLRGGGDFLSRLGLLYSELALVTFGGAYAVLSHVAERAVVAYGWLSASQMADGLGLAETTPGPLILVLQFVAFVGASHSVTGGSSLAFAIGASLLGIWFLFVPSFLWIFIGGPHIERISGTAELRSALQFITAAVVGVIANLSIWFAAHVVFATVGWARVGIVQLIRPDLQTVNPSAVALTLVAVLLLFGLRQSLGRTLAVSALSALLLRMLSPVA